MGVDHGCAHVLMSQQLLDRADVLPPFQQVGRKRVAEGVATGRLRESRLAHGPGPTESQSQGRLRCLYWAAVLGWIAPLSCPSPRRLLI